MARPRRRAVVGPAAAGEALVADAARRGQISCMAYAMPPVARHVDAVEAAAGRLVAWAAQAGLEAPVPTCRGWDVLDLVAHQGMVHRWATAIVRGVDPRTVDEAAFEAEGRVHEDPATWLAAGAADLVAALLSAPGDLDVMTFLREAPPPAPSGPGGSATRRPCTPSTHSPPRAAAAPSPRPTSGSTNRSPPTAWTSCSSASGSGATRARAPNSPTRQPFPYGRPDLGAQRHQGAPGDSPTRRGDGIPDDARPSSAPLPTSTSRSGTAAARSRTPPTS